MTNLNLKNWFKRRLPWGILLGLVFSILMVQNVLSRPATSKLEGPYLVWSLLWRGLVYGTIDGLLLTVFPWMVTWRAFNTEQKPVAEKIATAILTWIFIIFFTTSYHFGYFDFRSKKVMQANLGNTIISVPTLISANPIAAPIAHSALHIAAVFHSPETELFLPPHQKISNEQ